MIKKLLFISFLFTSFAYGQHIAGTPWMEELKKKNGTPGNAQVENFTIDEMRTAFDAYWADAKIDPRKKGSGFKQFKRWEYYWRHFENADGHIPTPKEYWQAYQNKVFNSATPNPTSQWTSVGPFEANVTSGRLPGLGRINAIIVDPNDDDTWYAGAPAGGIWKSTDAGDTWTNLFDDFPQIGVSGIAIDPNDSNIVYIATGDDDAGDSYSIGVFKSLDGGQTWNQTGLNPDNSTPNLLMNEIFLDPADSNIVWVGTSVGLQKSTDGGDTFTRVLNRNVRDFRLKPGDGNTVYAVSTSEYFKTTDGENFRTTSVSCNTRRSRSCLFANSANWR